MQQLNFISEPMAGLNKNSTIERLMQHAMRYQLFMEKRFIEEPDPKFYFPDCMKPMLAVDYSQNMSDPLMSFQLDRNFSWLDWSHAELVCYQKDIRLL